MGTHRIPVVVVAALVLSALPASLASAAARPFETRGATISGLATQPDPSGPRAASLTRYSEPTDAPMAFSMLALEAPAGSQLWFRTAEDGRWESWTYAPFLPDDEGPRVHDGDTTFTDALWVRAADRLQLRVNGADPGDVTVHLIDSTGVSLNLLERAASTLAPAPAHAATAPGYISRAQWGADESIRKGDPSYALPRMGIVHHTAGSNDYTRDESAAIVRGIYHYHVKTRGWSDIGYNLLVDKYGQVFEGRYGGLTRGVIGAHAANHNTGSFGVSLMGSFNSTVPSSAMLNALSRTLAWKFELHGINPRPGATINYNGEVLSTLGGHRDVGQTSCPGDHVYTKITDLNAGLPTQIAQGWTPFVGDWDGDGVDTAGWFKNGRWRIINHNADEAPVWDFQYGRTGDLPVVGDWDGDGRDSVGIVRDDVWHLRNTNVGGVADRTFVYGDTGRIEHPLAGDWDGDGDDDPGLVHDREWLLRFSTTTGLPEHVFVYGRLTDGDLPLVGDWDANGTDTPGIVRDGEWHLRNSLTSGRGEVVFTYGRVLRGDRPVTGTWQAGTAEQTGDRPAVIRGTGWYLRYVLGGGSADAFLPLPTPEAR